MATPEAEGADPPQAGPGMLHLHVSIRRRAEDKSLRATLRVVGLAVIIWRRRTFPAGTPAQTAKAEMIRYALQRFGGRAGLQWRQGLPRDGGPDDYS